MVLKELCALRGPSGFEHAVRDYIIEKATPLCTSVTVDRMGNVIAFKKGTAENPRHVLLDAHMDEVGFIVRGVNDNGLLSYLTLGGIDPRVVVSKRVRVGEEGVPGVIGCKAIHLQSPDEYHRVKSHDQLYIDIGAKSKEEALEKVQPGDFVTFDSDWVEFGESLIKARALDDRVGCMLLLSLMEGEYPCDVTFAFTVQEEIGLRGAACVGANVQPDCALALEGTTANDMGMVEEHLRVCSVGKGVALSFADRASIGHKDLGRALRDLADKEQIPWQVKASVSGGNDAGAIQTGSIGVPVAAVSVPCRYIHSPANVCSFLDIEAMFRLVDAFLMGGANF